MTNFVQARTAMVDCQVRPSDVTRYPVIEAMLSVAREEFVPQSFRQVAYVGEHIELAKNRVVLAPRTCAKMLDLAEIQSTDLVLDVGCGLGYMTALISRMAEAVVALEADDDLAAEATKILTEMEIDNVVVEKGALTAGLPDHGPYDLVVIEGAVEVLPDALVAQIKTGGRIVAIFYENGVGQCKIGHKTGDSVTWRRAFDATAPLLPGFERNKVFEF